MKLVVDASVAPKWFVTARPEEDHSVQAEAVAMAIEDSQSELFAPPHWIAEIAALLARVDPGVIDDSLLVLDDMQPVVIDGVSILRRAADLAISLDHHLFDTLYHAVALEAGATLVTADEAYFGKAKSLGRIALLADFTA